MKIAVIGANGKAGKLIVDEALSRKLDVTAITRDSNKSTFPAGVTTVLEKDVFDLTFDDIREMNIIVNAFGTWTQDTLKLHEKVARYLSGLLSGKPQKLLIVGGAGSLYVNENKQHLSQSEGFPDSYKPVAEAMAEALAIYRVAKNLNWVYLSPAAEFIAEGPRTGKYTLEGEFFTTNTNGESRISYADYALALIDVALSDKYHGQRISVRW